MKRLSHRRHAMAAACGIASLVLISAGLTLTLPAASAAGAVSIAVASTPDHVATGQALAYTIKVTNGTATAATGLTLTDTFSGIGPGAAFPSFVMSASSGTCADNTGTVTCTTASLGAGQVWTVTVTGQVTVAAGATLSDTATVTGTQASSFTASATTTTVVNPVLQNGFAQTQLAHGLKNPVVMAFAPNGDLYIGEQAGAIVIYRNGAILPTPVVTLPNVTGTGECGLLGLAFDPNFSTNGFLYVSYTVSTTSAGGVVQPFAQLSRFTVVNSTINPATEKVYFRGNQVQNAHHPGNDLKVGPDGKLWWSVGDNVPAITNGQTLTNIYGKMLRFNLDGSIPSDNPFLAVPNAVKAIYAYGLRNPFRFTFLPNGKAMTEDTGSSFWEELDTIQPGGNYGWDFYEGNSFGSGSINPAYAYGHMPQDGATSALAAYSGTAFPNAYNRAVFVGDYGRRDIEAVTFDPTYQTEVSDTVFSSNAGTIADLIEGPDGNLYFVSIFEGTLSKISAVGPFPPTASATATPNAGLAQLPVQFSSSGSSDPYGLPLTYSWNFGDGSALSTAANPAHTFTTNGSYTVTLTVSNGTSSDTASTRVVVGQTPAASITAPSTYNAGDTVSFSGNANDSVDGALAPYAYNWKVDFYTNGVAQPFYTAEVPYPFYGPITGVTSGSFQIPTDPSQTASSFYRITLTVTDSSGISTVVTKDLQPNVANWSAGANVAGAGYFVDGTWHTGPYNTTDVVGAQHVLAGLPLAQTINGNRYRLNGWTDGNSLSDPITVAPAGGSYTANFDQVTSTMPAPWQAADVGSPLMPGNSDYGASDQTFYSDGTGADVYGANDQFRYIYQTLNGDGTIVARVRYQSNSSPWAKAGVMIKQSPTAGAAFVDALVSPDVSPSTPNSNGVGCTPDGCEAPLPPVTPAIGNGARMQYSGSKSATPPSYAAGFSQPNKWVKLQRAGNTFTSWISADGSRWTQMGIATVSMTGPVTIGLFTTSHNIGQYSTAAFDNVRVTTTAAPPPPGPLPSPWADIDVGAPAITGSASYTNPVFTVNGAGADIYGTNDQFNYVYQPTTGNGTLVARVTSQTNTSANAKAGIIYKQSTTAGSDYILVSVAPGGGIKVQYSFSGSVGGGTFVFPNVWMKLVRTANNFTASVSSNGTAWTQVLSKNMTITANATAGLFVTSHNVNALGTATFDNVSYTPGP